MAKIIEKLDKDTLKGLELKLVENRLTLWAFGINLDDVMTKGILNRADELGCELVYLQKICDQTGRILPSGEAIKVEIYTFNYYKRK